MFEDNMLLPNLEFNPDFEGNMLNLKEVGNQAREAEIEPDYLMSLVQRSNGLIPHRRWVPRSQRERTNKD